MKKGEAAPKNVDDYISGVSEPAHSTLNKVRAAIRSAAPAKAIECISYGMPALKYKEILVWYAAFADHCSLFPTASIMQQLKDELVGYRTSKGTIQFPLDKSMPASSIKKIVKLRVKQIEIKKGR